MQPSVHGRTTTKVSHNYNIMTFKQLHQPALMSSKDAESAPPHASSSSSTHHYIDTVVRIAGPNALLAVCVSSLRFKVEAPPPSYFNCVSQRISSSSISLLPCAYNVRSVRAFFEYTKRITTPTNTIGWLYEPVRVLSMNSKGSGNGHFQFTDYHYWCM